MVLSAEQARELTPLFEGKKGQRLFRIVEKLTGLDKVNGTHQRIEDAGIPPGPDFAKAIMDDLGIDMQIGNPERLAFPEGPFITISNHFYGHIDGIALVDIVGHIRPRMKVLVNEVLMYLHGLAHNFISVNPTGTQRQSATATSINGIKSALLQIREGEPLALFPSGAVADWNPFRKNGLQERDWQDAAVKLIRKARVPVIPIRFFDHNSWFYYSLGLIDYRVRLVRLCHEAYNKRGTHPRMGIGPVITPQEQAAIPESEFKAFLRKSVYEMPLPDHFVLRSSLWQ